ncbi:MAG: hypothetical protein JXR84_13135 [Anaerolineae bacterium]|nr:hypothetical protein [Anaerolineae bacterium]
MNSTILPIDPHYPVLDEELAARLRAVRGKDAGKKRYTALMYGVARATPGVREDAIFDREREDSDMICSRSIWYKKWKKQPAIRPIWEYVEELTRTYREAETLRIEMQAQQLMRRALAEGQVDAVTGLRQTALNPLDRADYRTEASKTLLVLGNDEMSTRLAALGSRGVPVEISELPEQVVKLDVSGLPPEILRAIVDEGTDSSVADGCAESVSPAEPD